MRYGINHIAFSLVVALAGCNDSDFSGNNNAPNKRDENAVAGNPEDFDDKPGRDNDVAGNGRPLGNSADTDSDTDFGDFFDGLNDTDVGNFKPDISMEDLSVTFGRNEVFHLGDGSFDGSSCKFTVDTFSLHGTRYFFEFDVAKDATRINIRINRICGVDYDTNYAHLIYQGQKIETQQIPPNAMMLGFNTNMVNAGRYRIEVEAKTGAALDPTPGKTDADDFIIGDVTIIGSKKITQGQFGAN